MGEGVSSELLDVGGGRRIGGLEGAESQEEVGEGKLIGWWWWELLEILAESGIRLADVV